VHVRDPSDFFRDVRKEARVFLIRGSASSLGRGSAQIAEQLPAEFCEFANVFTYEDITNLKRPKGVKHAIDLKSRRKPPFQPLYNLLVKELAVLKDYLETGSERLDPALRKRGRCAHPVCTQERRQSAPLCRLPGFERGDHQEPPPFAPHKRDA